MSHRSLEDVLQAADNPVDLLRNAQVGPYAFPVVPAEFTNWRDEQQSWRESCALLDLSHHMTDLYVDGPDALRLLTDLGVNSFEGFDIHQGKQFVACNPDGYVIGDAILIPLGEDRFDLIGRPPALNWVQYHLETGDYDARSERDERSAINRGHRQVYRYQIQGPRAVDLMQKLTGKAVPDIRFFRMDSFTIARREVRALRHGMVGEPGWELWGPWDEGEEIREAIVQAGMDFGMRRVGSRAYPTTCLESGWIPSPLPAVYDGEAMRPYRQWLPATGYEATASLGGSYESDDVTDYYLTPYELGYGSFVRFDHDFVGRSALEKMAQEERKAGGPSRRKVTLVWNGDDVTRVIGSMFAPADEPAFKYIDLPLANYATLPYDRVQKDGETVGLSTYTGYSYNERSMLSLAIVEATHAGVGGDLALVWGESGGGTSKPTVERHAQTEIRARVGAVPISEVARVAYRPV